MNKEQRSKLGKQNKRKGHGEVKVC